MVSLQASLTLLKNSFLSCLLNEKLIGLRILSIHRSHKQAFCTKIVSVTVLQNESTRKLSSKPRASVGCNRFYHKNVKKLRTLSRNFERCNHDDQDIYPVSTVSKLHFYLFVPMLLLICVSQWYLTVQKCDNTNEKLF